MAAQLREFRRRIVLALEAQPAPKEVDGREEGAVLAIRRAAPFDRGPDLVGIIPAHPLLEAQHQPRLAKARLADQQHDLGPAFQSLFGALNETGITLLRALAPKLGLAEDYFDDKVRYGTSLLRVLHYPPLAADANPNAVRSAAHEDINFLTIMVAAKGAGLELLDRDGTWLPVVTEPTNLIVDSGDMLARMTNGVIPATTHRVVNPTGPNVSRYSMPFFMHPTLATSLEVLPSCVGDGAKFEPVTAGEFLDERLRAIGLKK